jgi:excinuclease UvrABC nuclease subunit
MQWSPCYSYTRTQVRLWTPTKRGLYQLLVKGKLIYIGQSRNLQKQLLSHFEAREKNRLLKKYLETGLCFFRFAELALGGDLLQTERDEILKSKPPCNLAEHPPVVGRWRKVKLSS